MIRKVNNLLLLLSVIFFFYWGFCYLDRDLSWDEVASIKSFSLQPVKYTVTNYPDVNNHVLNSLLYNFITRIYGIRDIYGWFDHVFILRLSQFIFSLLTLFYLYLFCKRFIGGYSASLSVLFLVTCIPWLNWAMQVRGYNISSLFTIMMLYHSLVFIRRSTKRDWGLFVLSLVLSLYTLPSNLYLVAALGMVYLVCWLGSVRMKARELKALKPKERQKVQFRTVHHFTRNSYFILLTGFAAAAVLTLIAYYPILDQVKLEIMGKRAAEFRAEPFYLPDLTQLMPYVLNAFLSWKYLLLIPAGIGLMWYFKCRKTEEKPFTLRITAVLSWLLFIPFIIPFIRGERPHDRTFLYLSPIFALLLADLTQRGINKAITSSKMVGAALIVIFIYSLSSYFLMDNKIQKDLLDDIRSGEKSNTILANFYQSDYYRHADLDLLIDRNKQDSLPVLFCREIDRLAMGEYLHKFNIKYYSVVTTRKEKVFENNEYVYKYRVLFEISKGKGAKPDYVGHEFPNIFNPENDRFSPLYYLLLQSKVINDSTLKFYVVTGAPNNFESMIKYDHPELVFKKLNHQESYHNIYLLGKR
jgi:hypothetical protein